LGAAIEKPHADGVFEIGRHRRSPPQETQG
jgi:hypothetical protein